MPQVYASAGLVTRDGGDAEVRQLTSLLLVVVAPVSYGSQREHAHAEMLRRRTQDRIDRPGTAYPRRNSQRLGVELIWMSLNILSRLPTSSRRETV